VPVMTGRSGQVWRKHSHLALGHCGYGLWKAMNRVRSVVVGWTWCVGASVGAIGANVTLHRHVKTSVCVGIHGTVQPEGPPERHMEGSCVGSILVREDQGGAGTVRVKRKGLTRFDDDNHVIGTWKSLIHVCLPQLSLN